MVKKIILVFKTHFDIGFTDLSSSVIDKYSDSMLKEVIATCKATQHMGKQQYVWTMPAWPLKVIIERCSLELRKELDELVERGQIVWHALPYTSHTDLCSAEEYIEGLSYGKDLSELYNKPYTLSAKMTDVPGHGIMLPSILSGAGVKFLHLGCNAFANPPKVPFLFNWESPDGERVLTMYSKGGYGTSLLPPKDWKYPVWMSLMHTHDNCGPQSVAAIEKMVKEVHKKYPDVEVVCGSMDDFYLELAKCDLENLPLVDKDLADSWIHGVASYPKETAVIREERERAKRLQALYAKKLIASADDSDDGFMEMLDQYYDNVNLFEEHTWGADVKTWLGPDRVYNKKEFIKAKNKKNYQFMENSWKEQRERANNASEARRQMKIQIENKSSQAISFFNPSSLAFTGWVILEDQTVDYNKTSLLINGKTLPITKINDEWACYAQELPPFTAVPVELKEGAILTQGLIHKEEDGVIGIENHRYALTISKVSGDILGLYDKQLDKMLLENIDDKPVFTYQYDRYGIEEVTSYLRDFAYRYHAWGIQDYGREAYPECIHRTYHPEYISHSINDHTITFLYKGDKSVELYGDAKEVSLSITLPPAGDELFIKLNLINKQETPYIESGTFLLPFADGQNYRINKSNSVLDPAKDIQEDANHVLYCLENFMSAENNDNGICIITKDAPLVSLGDTGIYKYQRNYKEADKSIAYFNLFNNMWGTNFPQWIEGDLSYRFVLFGYDKSESRHLHEKVAMLQEGIEITANQLEKDSSKLPEHMQLINVRKTEDGLVLRFKDLLGEKAIRKLEVPAYNITPIDLHNRRIDKASVDEVEFSVGPYGIYSFLISK